jgi:hypothetical protein
MENSRCGLIVFRDSLRRIMDPLSLKVSSKPPRTASELTPTELESKERNVKFRTLTTATLFGVLAIPACLGAQNTSPNIITFDAPGADTTVGSSNGTQANSINDGGAITGNYYDVNGASHAFLRSPEGNFTTVDFPGADGTQANSINDLGAITGNYYDVNGNHGFLRDPEGNFTTFDVSSAVDIFAVALSQEGFIVGYYLDPNSLFHAFLRSPDGTLNTFVGPESCDTGTGAGCFGSQGSNINLLGASVGNYQDNGGNFVSHIYLRSPEGTMTPFEAPGAGTGTYQGTGCSGCFSGLNRAGAIAGIYTDANKVFHSFLRSPTGEFTKIDAPGAGTGAGQGTGCFSECPVGLNDSGMIMGTYIDANNVIHGFLRSPAGQFTTVDPPGSAATQPQSMNDSGAITGYYIDANNVFRGFLWVP